MVATRVELSVLGGFDVRVNGHPVASRHWSRRDSSALVKLLAITPLRTLHREVVMDALWPDLDTDAAAPRLHKAAHYARKHLGHRGAVVLSANGVSLCPHDDVRVDLVQFRRHAEDALRSGGVAAAKRALSLYGGELLPRDIYEPWAEPHRTHVHRLHLEMLHQAEDWHQVLAADPADEAAHLALAQQYAMRGDRAAALRQLDQLDHAMREDFDLAPSEQALDLRAKVIQSDRRHSSSNDPRGVGPDTPASATAELSCCA
ncbi:MAG TPA: BTAD domain-containing putative transcriptional regulator [Nocardioides sp.]|uniref:AfsR/SARP family transcriptional regulator n=1 Tax=Nocardioides sp. TaxID=35761 RepID=UPI002E37E62C|nr:BTAD domain-containing putative transcriptional regulator [Nocardioides sp.]HEX5086849.1 BTAD domain-containing putative transcriptional regulator [Nocardioides sp.]